MQHLQLKLQIIPTQNVKDVVVVHTNSISNTAFIYLFFIYFLRKKESIASSHGPIHRAHAVADLNQSETWNAAIFSADFWLTSWYHKPARHTLTQCGFVILVQSPHSQIYLEQFSVRISTDKAPTPLTKFGICSFFFFFFCHSPFFLSFFLCITLSDSWRFSLF